MRSRRGFTLLEMIVATVIMAIAVVGLLSGLAGATRNAARLRDYDRVAELARLRMNDLIADDSLRPGSAPGGIFAPSLTGGLNAGWQARVDAMEAPPHPAGPGELVLDHIMLQIWWMSGETRRSFSLETVRQRQVTAADQ